MRTKNIFYDINKFPKGEGILWMPISMSKISNSQNASQCFQYIEKLNPSKINDAKVGASFIYGDFLYLYNEGHSIDKKDSYTNLCLGHANASKKVLEKPYSVVGSHKSYYIQSAFTFTS